MKTKRTIKSAGLILCFALVISLVCSLGITASANEPAALAVGDTNLRYDKQTEIIVTVTGEVPDGYTKGIAVWNADVAEPAADNVSYYNFNPDTKDNVEFYATRGIAADDLGKELTVAPALKDASGNKTIAGDMVKKSLIGYVSERLNEDELKGYQIELYRDLVVYGVAAEKVIDGANTTKVVVAKSGYVGNKYLPIAIAEGETALLRAPVQNTEGEYFSYWADAEGKLVSGKRVLSVDVAAGLNTFTAVYETKATSAYGYFADINQYAAGDYQFTKAQYVAATEKANGVKSIAIPFLSTDSPDVSSKLTGAAIDVIVDETAIESLNDSDFVPASAILSSSVVTFKENYDGAKYLSWNRTAEVSTYGYYGNLVYTYKGASQSNYNGFEMDLCVKPGCGTIDLAVRFNGASYGLAGFNIGRGEHEGKDCLKIGYNTASGFKYLYFDDNGGKNVVTLKIDGDDAVNVYFNDVKQTLEAPVVYTYDPQFKPGVHNVSLIQFYQAASGTFDLDIYTYGLVADTKIKQ